MDCSTSLRLAAGIHSPFPAVHLHHHQRAQWIKRDCQPVLPGVRDQSDPRWCKKKNRAIGCGSSLLYCSLALHPCAIATFSVFVAITAAASATAPCVPRFPGVSVAAISPCLVSMLVLPLSFNLTPEAGVAATSAASPTPRGALSVLLVALTLLPAQCPDGTRSCLSWPLFACHR